MKIDLIGMFTPLKKDWRKWDGARWESFSFPEKGSINYGETRKILVIGNCVVRRSVNFQGNEKWGISVPGVTLPDVDNPLLFLKFFWLFARHIYLLVKIWFSSRYGFWKKFNEACDQREKTYMMTGRGNPPPWLEWTE